MDFLPYQVTKIGYSPDKKQITERRQELDEVISVMRTNIEKLMDRGERLDQLAARAEVLDTSSLIYQNTAVVVKNASRLKNTLPKMLIGLLVVAVCLVSGISFSLV